MIFRNFSISANDDVSINFDASVGLSGATVTWRAFAQSYGVPTEDVDPVIQKSSASGDGIEILESPPTQFVLSIDAVDTLDLLRNYYYEAIVVSPLRSTVFCGIMTVTPTEIR